MAELAQLTRTARGGPLRARRTAPQHRYMAFLSYSHDDAEVAEWLHEELEEFHVPPRLVGKLTDQGPVPKRLAPIFRDRHELAAAHDLGEEIEEAIAGSRFLIVLCSPAAAKSPWIDEEIACFKRLHREERILAAIVSGEPCASDTPGREGDECFPPSLRVRFDRRGRPTGQRAEPIAADLRDEGDGRKMGLLKIAAGMMGVGLDDLAQREAQRRHRRLYAITAASVAGMLFASGLAYTAIDARDAARDQRREAEGLVEFMLGDLRSKLEPIGRLDALDGVGSRVLAYYSKQDASDLSDAGLLQRSRALSLTAEVAKARGNLDGALRLYQEAMIGTAEAVRRDPDDPQRLFDHAQNVFYAGEIARTQADLGRTERAMREYKRLALRMVSLDPDNIKWRMEVQYAETNLGVVLYDQRRFAQAASQFEQALATIEALATADPQNSDYQKWLAEALAWVGDAQGSAQVSEGRLDDAIAVRERNVALLDHLFAQKDDVAFGEKLVPARRALGNLYADSGHVDLALRQFQTAIDDAERLTSVDMTNSRWRQIGYKVRLDFAKYLLIEGRREDAAIQTRAACETIRELLVRNSGGPAAREGMRNCWMMRARLAVADGDLQQASSFAQRAEDAAKSVSTTDPAQDKYGAAESFRLLGDIRQRLGDKSGAATAWNAGLRAIPAGVAEKPNEMAEHALLLQRLGRVAEARERAAKLATIGYRNPQFRKI
jgi:tetratricopeptide (TPR) repeat protein